MRHVSRWIVSSFAALCACMCATSLAQAQDVQSETTEQTIPEGILGGADEDLKDIPVIPLRIFGPCPLKLAEPINCPVGVILGRMANLREAPWQAQIFASTKASDYRPAILRDYPLWELNHICGGALIYSNWILTAAHCVLDPRFDKASTRIRLGTNDVSVNDGQTFAIERVVVHSGYNARTRLNDIALIRVAGTFNFGSDRSSLIASVPLHGTLASGPRLEPWHRMSVTGWGVTSTGPFNHASALLKKLHLNRVPNDLCRQALKGGTTIVDDSVICGAADEGDTCQGDSGGPLVVDMYDHRKETDIAVLVGLVSWGRGCAVKGNPGVYTRITSHLNWIRRAMAVPSNVTALR